MAYELDFVMEAGVRFIVNGDIVLQTPEAPSDLLPGKQGRSPMSLFSDIQPDQGIKTVIEAVKRLQERLPWHRPHSLCEAGARESDYQWLCHWAEHLSYDTVKLTK
jgi:hypothetical protein